MSDEDEELAAEVEQTGLVVVDPEPACREAAEALVESLGRAVLAVDPSEFKPDESEDIQNAAAFVLSWDLGVGCAADLVEAIRADAKLRDRKVLIATDAPTRSLVVHAMAVGADGFCRRPYEAEDLAANLERVGLAPPPPPPSEE